MVPGMVKIYEFNIRRMKRSKSFTKSFVTKDETEDANARLDALLERGRRVLYGEVMADGKKRFEGYSMNNMKRIHAGIAKELESGKSFDDVAVYVRQSFGEFYTGQAKTIVRTEYASAMAKASYQFGRDLGTISKRTTKTWITMDDEFTRDDHIDLDQEQVSGKAEDVPNMYFKVGGKNYLRYPKDEAGSAKDVINCRCDLLWEVTDWGKE
jgi:hypothetical protein